MMGKIEPKLAYRDGSREVWETENGFTVITPLGAFECPDSESISYILTSSGLVILKRKEEMDGNHTRD